MANWTAIGDRVGEGAAVACALHCAAVPIVLAVAGASPASSHGAGEPWVIGLVALLGAGALAPGIRRHGRLLPLGLFAGGILLLVAGHAFITGPHPLVGVSAATLMLSAQWVNRAGIRTCGCPMHAARNADRPPCPP